MKLLKDIAEVRTGVFHRTIDGGEIAYLQSKHFDENGCLVEELYPELLMEDVSEKHLLKSGDVVFAAKGTKNFAAVFKNVDTPTVASTSFFVISITNNSVLPEYLAWFINHHSTQSSLKDNARGSSMPSIRKSVIEELELNLPPLEKQELILKISTLFKYENELTLNIIKLREKIIDQQLIKAIK